MLNINPQKAFPAVLTRHCKEIWPSGTEHWSPVPWRPSPCATRRWNAEGVRKHINRLQGNTGFRKPALTAQSEHINIYSHIVQFAFWHFSTGNCFSTSLITRQAVNSGVKREGVIQRMDGIMFDKVRVWKATGKGRRNHRKKLFFLFFLHRLRQSRQQEQLTINSIADTDSLVWCCEPDHHRP